MNLDSLFEVLELIWIFLVEGCMDFLSLLNGTLSEAIRSVNLGFLGDALSWVTDTLGIGSWNVSVILFASVGLVFIVRPIISAFRAMF